MSLQKRIKVITLRLTPIERRILDQMAKYNGVSASDVLRTLLMDKFHSTGSIKPQNPK